MSAPTQCPVCGQTQIQPVLKKAVLSAAFGGEVNKISGVMAYRCVSGHVFLTVSERVEPEPSRNGTA